MYLYIIYSNTKVSHNFDLICLLLKYLDGLFPGDISVSMVY